MMPTLEQIQDFAQRVGEEFSPQRVILFGSYAYVLAALLDLAL